MKKYSYILRGLKGRHAKAWVRRFLDAETRFQAGIKIGDLVNDCDGFNHRVTAIETLWLTPCASGRFVRGQFAERIFTKEGGGRFCHVTPPRTKEDISKTITSWAQNTDVWWAGENEAQRSFILSGRTFCNEDGTQSDDYLAANLEYLEAMKGV